MHPDDRQCLIARSAVLKKNQKSNKTQEKLQWAKVSRIVLLFGSKVLVEVPQSILERRSNVPRFISAAFIVLPLEIQNGFGLFIQWLMNVQGCRLIQA